jgi:hypothetical protein
VTLAVALAVVGLGVFHGANPAMGWLFAVALGQQERARSRAPAPLAPVGPPTLPDRSAPGAQGPALPPSQAPPSGQSRAGRSAPVPAPAPPRATGRERLAVLRALPPIAAGHLASVAAVAVAFAVTQSAVASRTATVVGGALLVGLGLWRLLSSRHFRWVGMRLSGWELAGWSFLMSSVHGAGLMLVPVLAHHSPLPVTASAGTALLAALLHTLAMLGTATVVALLVSEVLGLAVLRSAWLNVDKVWAVALLGAGAVTLLTAT